MCRVRGWTLWHCYPEVEKRAPLRAMSHFLLSLPPYSAGMALGFAHTRQSPTVSSATVRFLTNTRSNTPSFLGEDDLYENAGLESRLVCTISSELTEQSPLGLTT